MAAPLAALAAGALVYALARSKGLPESAWIGPAGAVLLLFAALAWFALHQHRRLAAAEHMQRTQAERMRTLELLSALIESSTDGIYAKDLDGRYTLVNPAACGWLERPPEAILDKTAKDLFPPDQSALLEEFDYRALAEGRTFTEELALDTPSGRRLLQITKGPLRDADGRVSGTFGLARDIGEQRRTEANQQEHEALLREMSAVAHIGGWAFDPVTRQGTWTTETAHIYGLPEAPPITLEESITYYLPEHRQAIAAAVREIVEFARPYDLELELLTAAGRRKWVRTIAHPTVEGGRVVKVWGALQDITARKAAEQALARQAEELRERNEEMERFNRAAVGRELAIVALKQEVNALAVRLGEPSRYPLEFLDDEGGPTP